MNWSATAWTSASSPSSDNMSSTFWSGSSAELERLLRAKAVLLPGVKVTLHVEKGKEVKSKTWSYPDGLKGYLEELAERRAPVAPIFEGETYLGKPKDGDTFAEGEGAAWALAWYEEGGGAGESYVNLIPTPAGGTHEAGLARRRCSRR